MADESDEEEDQELIAEAPQAAQAAAEAAAKAKAAALAAARARFNRKKQPSKVYTEVPFGTGGDLVGHSFRTRVRWFSKVLRETLRKCGILVHHHFGLPCSTALKFHTGTLAVPWSPDQIDAIDRCGVLATCRMVSGVFLLPWIDYLVPEGTRASTRFSFRVFSWSKRTAFVRPRQCAIERGESGGLEHFIYIYFHNKPPTYGNSRKVAVQFLAMNHSDQPTQGILRQRSVEG